MVWSPSSLSFISLFRTATLYQKSFLKPSALVPSRLHRIPNRMVQGVSIIDGQIININPANGQEISRVPCSTKLEIDDMMERALQTQKSNWGRLPAGQRIEHIRHGLRNIIEQTDTITTMIVQEMGKPMHEAQVELRGVHNKEAHLQIMEEMSQPVYNGDSSVVIRTPVGVVVILSPWNYPCDEILLLALPALAAGNTVIVKPSEVTPESGALTVHALARGLPPGVLQLAQGDGSVGRMLVSHPCTAMVAMTGSSATGKAILSSAAPELKRCVLELGGKDPMIVFDDCLDIDRAAQDAVMYSLSNTGQVCCSIERIYVAEDIYENFASAVSQIAASYKVGDGMDPTVKVGPLVSAMQRDKVRDHVKDAVKMGAKILYQSDVVGPSDGLFYPVTVLGDVQDGMKVYREETFGPIICLTKFDGSEDEAIRLANDSEYGLASSVYTADLDKARRVASHIDAGQVGINCYAIDNMHEACPWVGHKSSGMGHHSGREGFLNFSIPKTIVYSGAAPRDQTDI